MALRLGIGLVLPDILNVKDFGALGDGSHNDTPNIQAAIDSAFGTAGSPHGTSATLNKALYFPQGNYALSGGPVVLTQVRGARIFGAGPLATNLLGAGGAVVTNGLQYCAFENIAFQATGGSGIAAFELDWNGTGSVGLQGNVFTNCSFGPQGGGAIDYGMRIGLSGHGGANNQFFSCIISGCTVAGFSTWTATATGQMFQGGGSANNVATGFWIKAGQIASICDAGLSGNGTQDFLMDSDGPILLKGNRTESPLSCVFNSATSVAVLDGHSASASVHEFCRTKGKVILDSCATDSSASPATVLCTDASYTGKAYARGCFFPNVHFFDTFISNGGTVPQNI